MHHQDYCGFVQSNLSSQNFSQKIFHLYLSTALDFFWKIYSVQSNRENKEKLKMKNTHKSVFDTESED